MESFRKGGGVPFPALGNLMCDEIILQMCAPRWRNALKEALERKDLRNTIAILRRTFDGEYDAPIYSNPYHFEGPWLTKPETPTKETK